MAWTKRDVLIAIHCVPTEDNSQLFGLVSLLQTSFPHPPYVLTHGDGVEIDGVEVLRIAGEYSDTESAKMAYVKSLELAKVLGRKFILFVSSEFGLESVSVLVAEIEGILATSVANGIMPKQLFVRQNDDHTEVSTDVIFGAGSVLKPLSPLIGMGASLGKQIQTKITEYGMESICEELTAGL